MNLMRPDIHVTYGIGLAAQVKTDEAERQFRCALELQPDHIPAHIELAKLCIFRGKVREAIRHLDHTLALDPACAEALFLYGRIFLEQQQDEKAQACYSAAAAMAPESAGLYADALARLLLPEMQEDRNELRWILFDRGYVRRKYEMPRWHGEPIHEKTLLVYTEGGFGDTIQLSRYLPLIQPYAQGRVVLECQKELAGLLACCQGVDEVVIRDITVFQPACKFDLVVGLMDLPLLFAKLGVKLPRQIPYLNVEPTSAEKWKARLSGYSGWKVGLRWAGNPKYVGDGTRSCHLANFAPLADVPDVTFFSLQKGARQEEAQHPPAGMPLVDLSSELHDFMDTAALLSQLDLILSTDTSVPHVAGALGIPTWLMLDSAPNNRWHRAGENCAWYPTMRLFRQPGRGDWNAVLVAAARALTQLVMSS